MARNVTTYRLLAMLLGGATVILFLFVLWPLVHSPAWLDWIVSVVVLGLLGSWVAWMRRRLARGPEK